MFRRFHGFTKTLLFWLILVMIFLCGSWFAYHYFAKAFPILDLDLTMGRYQALQQAKIVAEKNNWGPADYQQAASFDVDSETKNFIELEGGGLTALKKVLKDPDYSPYAWSVRHFKEYEINETTIFFKPEGTLYGFIETIAESEPGPALSPEKARAIAIAYATAQWHIDFTNYAVAETSQEIRQNGRIDHTFVYERTDKKIGEAPYRLTLMVSGDKCTQLQRSIKVPETFIRHYQEMRSTNAIIAFIALALVVILYVFGGFIALIFLLRNRWLLWKIPVIIGIVIGILQAAAILNELPLYWKMYPTSLSIQSFLGQIIISMLLTVFAYTGIASLVIMLAEGLTRKAFPHHIQFWRLWSKTAGHSVQVIGRTIGSYLILGFDFAFVIGFYYLAFHYFGWWSPAEELYSPNILAHYLPWLSPIVNSFSAGFLEECLFRAIPLSCAALLGNRFGKRSWWLAGAFIVQALIFGGAHATYPAQPAYARLVELIIPSFVFGGMYLAFGLMPSIVAHYIYDVVWFSLPIFISTSSSILIAKIFIIIAALFPLLIIIYRIVQAKKITDLPFYFYNRAWQAPELTVSEKKEKIIHQTIAVPSSYKYIFGMIGIIAVMTWLFTTRFISDGLPVELSRTQAIEVAQKTVNERDGKWQILSNVMESMPSKAQEQKIQHAFAWRTLGKNGYQQLLHEEYLTPYAWIIRFVHFTGDVNQRAEEHQIILRTPSSLIEHNHILPEEISLPSLAPEQARKKVYEFLHSNYGLNIKDITEISAVPKKQPHRVDWVFTFSVPSSLPLQEGQQRVIVSIAGNQVNDSYRSLFVPEAWKRSYTEELTNKNLISTINDFLFILLIIGALIILATQINIYSFSWNTFIIFFTILFSKSLLQMINIWPTAVIFFNTTEPFHHQFSRTIIFWLITAFAKSTSYGVLASIIKDIYPRSPQFHGTIFSRIIIALSLGSVVAGIGSLCNLFSPSINPLWPDFDSAGARLPALGFGLINLTNYLEITLIVLALVLASDIFTKGWQRNKIPLIIISLMLGILLIGHTIETITITSWLLCGIVMGILFSILYSSILRFDKATIPLTVGMFMIFNALQQAIFNAYSGAVWGGIITIILVCSVMMLWYWLLNKNSKEINV